jgi:hypothetical protein
MYHYSDNWDGSIKKFPTLAKAVKSAKKEEGESITIFKGREIVKITPASGNSYS